MAYWYSPIEGYHEGDSVFPDDVAALQRPDATCPPILTTSPVSWGTPVISPAAKYAAAIAAGCAIASTSTPSLNGTYSLTEAARGNIQAAYIGIKSGDGPPGGGASFNYLDQNGGAHTFTATTFPPFAIAMRDYYYALTQGQAPAQPVTIP
jgi:hypothetical protein